MRSGSSQPLTATVRRKLVVAVVVVFSVCLGSAPAFATSAQSARFLTLAEHGVARAQHAYADGRHGVWNGHVNVPLQWYEERLHDPNPYPLATIWGAVPLFESLAAVAEADPTAANRASLDRFAEGQQPAATPPGSFGGATIHVYKGAESYWDPAVGGYGPYPGDRGPENASFDDNAWWGIGFVDAYRVLGKIRLLRDAQVAFSFILRRGWDPHGGGLWWNTHHRPAGQKSGETLAAGSLLGVLLGQAWQKVAAAASGTTARKARAQAQSDLSAAEKFLAWGDAHFADGNGLYVRTQDDSTPMPYVAGPEIEAKEVLCELLAAGNHYCVDATRLAGAAYTRFADRLDMGPQYDVINLHWMLVYAAQTGDARWASLALEMGNDAVANSLDPATGLYLLAWDGSDMSSHQADPGMRRTDAATVELFGWLAGYGF